MFRRWMVIITLAVMVFFVGVDAANPDVLDEESGVMEGAITSLYRLTDINTGALHASPSHLAVYNGTLFFSAYGSDGWGRELWKYDPVTGAGHVANIFYGTDGSFPYYLTTYNGALYFTANGDDGTGRELWRYHPQSSAQRIADINTGALGSDPAFLTVYSGSLYFQANGTDGAGRELWRYDPANGARRAADIASGASSSYPVSLVVYNNMLYFGADGNDGAGKELWRYSPAAGAHRVEDICSGPCSSEPDHLAVYAGALYFSADGNDGAGKELWRYDPVNGAQRVADISPGRLGSSPIYLASYNGALYFSAIGQDTTGSEIWKYTLADGATRVADIWPGSHGSGPAYMTVYDGALYFSADGNDGFGDELWRYSTGAASAFRSVKSQDGWVLESGETTNTGGMLNVSTTTFNLGDDAQDRQYRAVLSFDTSTLPDTAVVTNVTVSIRRQSIVGSNPFATHGNIIADIRNGPFSGNNTLQAADFQAAASRQNIGTIRNLPDANGRYSASLVSTAYSSVNKKGLTQVRLRFATDDNNDNGADFIRFFSGNDAMLSNRPLLQVTYYVP